MEVGKVSHSKSKLQDLSRSLVLKMGFKNMQANTQNKDSPKNITTAMKSTCIMTSASKNTVTLHCQFDTSAAKIHRNDLVVNKHHRQWSRLQPPPRLTTISLCNSVKNESFFQLVRLCQALSNILLHASPVLSY